MASRVFPALLVLATFGWVNVPAAAQECCSFSLGDTACRMDWDSSRTQFTVYVDYFADHRPILPWKPSLEADKGSDRAVGVQLLQKPGVVFWLKPIQHILGFNLQLEF